MAVSVRMDALLEKELVRAAKRAGVTKSQFIIDAIERALGRKNPYELLLRVEEELAPGVDAGAGSAAKAAPIGETGPAEPTHRERLQRILREKHEAEVKDWLAWQAERERAVPVAAEPSKADRGIARAAARHASKPARKRGGAAR